MPRGKRKDEYDAVETALEWAAIAAGVYLVVRHADRLLLLMRVGEIENNIRLRKALGNGAKTRQESAFLIIAHYLLDNHRRETRNLLT